MSAHEKFNFTSLDQLREKIDLLGVDLTLSEDLSPLSRPVKVGGKTAPNALAVLPMEGCDSNPDGSPSELVERRYTRFASGGAGLLWWEACAVVESVKAASDVYTPVSGEILEVNEELSNDPSLINSDPYGAGWLYKIRLDVPTETEDMMNATDYEEYCS